MTRAIERPAEAYSSHPFLGRTLADCIVQGRDNFLLLRFLAAALVIFGHSWATANNPGGATDWLGRQTLVFSGTVAVDVFFWVSGFLVTMSFARRRSVVAFALARILRIFPGLTACVLFGAVVLGVGVSTLSARDYLVDPGVRRYVFGNVTLTDLQWFLPGVFEGNRHKGVVNASLWTLPAEIRMYALVLGLGALGLLRSSRRFGVALAVLTAIALYVPSIKLLQHPGYYEFAAFFAFGAFCYFHRDAVPVSGYVLLTLAFSALALRGHPGYELAIRGLIAYAALWFAYGARLPQLPHVGDYSYGLYLYGFPMQQLVALWRPEWGPWRSLLLSLPLALLLAVASWHFVEEPALRWKPYGRRTEVAAA